MLPAIYQRNRSSGSGEEVFECFFTKHGHGGLLEFPIMAVLNILVQPPYTTLKMEFN